MMNMYREEENEKASLSDKLRNFKENLKNEFATSAVVRHQAIRKISRAIIDLDPADTKSIETIKDIISQKDLCDPRYGKTVDEEVMQLFVVKVMKNRELVNEKTAQNNNTDEMGS